MARTRRRSRKIRKLRYNVEQRRFFVNSSDWTSGGSGEYNYNHSIELVPASETEGVRKVKHISADISYLMEAANTTVVYYAIVYVPEGTLLTKLRTTGDLYRPSSYVLGTGLINMGVPKAKIYTRLSKNLNAGDKIVLIFGTQQNNKEIQGIIKYAVAFN